MKAFQFLDIEFQKKAIEISKMKSDTYDVKVGGEAQAQRMLLDALRIFYKWYAVPKVIGKYLLVRMGVIPNPVSPLVPQEVKQQAAQAEGKVPLHAVPQGCANNEGTAPPTA